MMVLEVRQYGRFRKDVVLLQKGWWKELPRE